MAEQPPVVSELVEETLESEVPYEIRISPSGAVDALCVLARECLQKSKRVSLIGHGEGMMRTVEVAEAVKKIKDHLTQITETGITSPSSIPFIVITLLEPEEAAVGGD